MAAISFTTTNPDANDSEVILLQKWLQALGGSPDTSDSEVILLQKIATKYTG